MIDIVFPERNEVKFIEIAEKLRIDGLIFVYSRPKDIGELQRTTKIKLYSAVICDANEIKRYKGKILTFVRAPEDQFILRDLIEGEMPDMIFGLELNKRKDFIHHRSSGLNQVLSESLREKGVCVGFNISEIIKLNRIEKSVVLGRFSQNIRLAKKFGFKIILASFAHEPFGLKPQNEILSLLSSLGIHKQEKDMFLGWRH